MDPYQILEVSPNASQEEIRTAYRRLVKKYHPDRYPEGPQRDLATEKIKKINAAYDMIQNGNTASARNSAGSDADFARVRQLIQANNLTAAAHILDAMAVRNAQWYYLYGVINLRRGWYDNAKSCFETAVSMDPGNPEYQAANNSTHRMSQPYGYTNTTHHTTNNSGCCSCDLCTTLLCMDCCCECMGGDLIRCC